MYQASWKLIEFTKVSLNVLRSSLKNGFIPVFLRTQPRVGHITSMQSSKYLLLLLMLM